MSNPEAADIERALQLHLEELEPAWATKKLGIAFKPTNGPWQRGTWMPARPARVAIGGGAYHRLNGIYQVDLFYPKSERRTDLLLARAKAVKRHFYPEDAQGFEIDAGAGQIVFDREPAVSGLDEASDAAYLRVFVEVFARIELPPA
jgi:hypothetical protein